MTAETTGVYFKHDKASEEKLEVITERLNTTRRGFFTTAIDETYEYLKDSKTSGKTLKPHTVSAILKHAQKK